MKKILVKCTDCSAGRWRGTKCKCKKRESFLSPCQFCGELDERTSPLIKLGIQKTTCIKCRNLFAKINTRRRTKGKKVLKINQKNYEKIVGE